MSSKPNSSARTAAKKAARRRKPHAPPPAYFLSLTVENIRCFGPEQTLDLSDGHGRPARWTVLLGDNGAGKTTLLQCLALVEPVELGDLDPNPKALGPRAYGPVDARIQLSSFCRRGARSFGVHSQACYGAALSSRRKPTPVGGPAFRGNTPRAHYLGPAVHRSRSDHEQLGGLHCYGYGAARLEGRSPAPNGFADQPSASLFVEDAPLRNAEEWLLLAAYAATEDSGVMKGRAEWRERIRRMLVDALPDAADVRFSDQPEPGRPLVRPHVEVKTPYGWISLENLSLGYRAMVAWLVDLASRLFERYPHAPNPLEGPAVALIDEIDLHLHPKWQRMIVQHLSERFPNTQFVVTAHSPLVVQAAGQDANVAVLRREGDHVVIDRDVEAVRGWRVDQVLTSDLFGLKTARPPQLEAAIEERRKLLGKSRLRKKDRERLAELEAQIGDLPTEETQEGREAMDIIRRVAQKVKQREAEAGDQDP